MTRNIWLVLGIIGVLLGNPSADTYAKVKVKIGIAVGQRTSHRHHRRYWHRRDRYWNERARHHDNGRLNR